MEEILILAKKHDLFVIEDNAQAIGANYKFSNGEIKKQVQLVTLERHLSFHQKIWAVMVMVELCLPMMTISQKK